MGSLNNKRMTKLRTKHSFTLPVLSAGVIYGGRRQVGQGSGLWIRHSWVRVPPVTLCLLISNDIKQKRLNPPESWTAGLSGHTPRAQGL